MMVIQQTTMDVLQLARVKISPVHQIVIVMIIIAAHSIVAWQESVSSLLYLIILHATTAIPAQLMTCVLKGYAEANLIRHALAVEMEVLKAQKRAMMEIR